MNTMLAAAAVLLGLVRLLNGTHGWRRQLREKDDLAALWACQSSAGKALRRFYRFLPSDPRCRFCLGPFGGLGRVLGLRPSPKNPNFCPG